MLTEKGTFTEGVIVADRIYTGFELEEEILQHTYDVMNDRDIDNDRLAKDSAYFNAALLAKRVRIEGLDRRLTPEEMLDISGDDGRAIQMVSATLEQRRLLFRKSLAAGKKGPAGHDEAGLSTKRAKKHEQGRD